MNAISQCAALQKDGKLQMQVKLVNKVVAIFFYRVSQ